MKLIELLTTNPDTSNLTRFEKILGMVVVINALLLAMILGGLV